MVKVEGADPTRELALAYTTFTVPPPINAKSEDILNSIGRCILG